MISRVIIIIIVIIKGSIIFIIIPLVNYQVLNNFFVFIMIIKSFCYLA